MVDMYKILLGVTLLLNSAKSEDDVFCDTLSAGSAEGSLREFMVKSYNADDVIDIGLESQCNDIEHQVIGVTVSGCYHEHFKMSVDPELEQLHVLRNESDSNEVWLYMKVYCEASPNVSQELKPTEEDVTEKVLTEEVVTEEVVTEKVVAEKVKQAVNVFKVPNLVSQQFDDNSRRVEHDLYDAQRNVESAQMRVELAVKALNKAQRGVNKAQKGVNKAKKAVESAKKGVVEAQRGVNRVEKQVNAGH